MWTMLGWVSWAASFASSMNMPTNSALSVMWARIRLIATVFWKPSTPRMRAFQTSAMPPTAMRSSNVYWPKRSPGWSSTSSRKVGIGMRCVAAASNVREAGAGCGRGGAAGGVKASGRGGAAAGAGAGWTGAAAAGGGAGATARGRDAGRGGVAVTGDIGDMGDVGDG